MASDGLIGMYNRSTQKKYQSLQTDESRISMTNSWCCIRQDASDRFRTARNRPTAGVLFHSLVFVASDSVTRLTRRAVTDASMPSGMTSRMTPRSQQYPSNAKGSCPQCDDTSRPTKSMSTGPLSRSGGRGSRQCARHVEPLYASRETGASGGERSRTTVRGSSPRPSGA